MPALLLVMEPKKPSNPPPYAIMGDFGHTIASARSVWNSPVATTQEKMYANSICRLATPYVFSGSVPGWHARPDKFVDSDRRHRRGVFPYGGGLAKVINRHVEGYNAVAEATGASEENVGLVFQGNSDIALALADTVFQAYSGTGAFKGHEISSLRELRSIPTPVTSSPWRTRASLSDLSGKRVLLGAPGSGTTISAEALLQANGIDLDDEQVQRLDFNETAAALRDGQIDAGFLSVGPPTSSILDLATTRDVVLVPLTEAQIAAAQEVDPSYAPYTMAAETYPGQTEDVLALSTSNVLIVSEEMDEELAYGVVKALYENVEELIAIHPAANDTTVEFSMEATPIPLHPGTLRYYREVGAEVPERLVSGQ